MKIETSYVGDIAILQLDGELTLGDGTLGLRNSVHEALLRGNKKIILQMSKVNHMDTSGVSELVALLALANSPDFGANIKLACLKRKVKKLFVMNKLRTTFTIFDDIPETLKAFSIK
jgi:anti-sigma B factor antagonist